MAQETDNNHQFLDLNGDGMEDHSFLGRTEASTRGVLFIVLAAVSAVFLGAVYFYVDQKIGQAINQFREAGDDQVLVYSIGRKLAKIEELENNLIIESSPANREIFANAIENIEMDLDNLRLGLSNVELREHMATIRDGIVQYNQKILENINTEKMRSKDSSAKRYFSEIMSYIEPSLGFLRRNNVKHWKESLERIDQSIIFSRYVIGGAGIAALLWLVFWGTVLLNSLARPLSTLANTAVRLMNGERKTAIPIRGNTDASGIIARAFNKWAQDLADIEILRRELQELQLGIEQVARRADDHNQAGFEMTNVELDAHDPMRPNEKFEDTDVTLEKNKELSTISSTAEMFRGGPISSASQQLSHFSEYVSHAAYDVERMEVLVRSLSDTVSNVELLGNLVTAVRDQMKSFGLKLSPQRERTGDIDNFVTLDDSMGTTGHWRYDSEAFERFATIGETMGEVEHALKAIKLSIDDISSLAQEMAITASRQAVEATNKLLAQSQFLQNMLDDIVARINSSKLESQNSPDLGSGALFRPKNS